MRICFRQRHQKKQLLRLHENRLKVARVVTAHGANIIARKIGAFINVSNLPGKPDIALLKYKTVIFVNGCYCIYFIHPPHQFTSCKRNHKGKMQGDNFQIDKAVYELYGLSDEEIEIVEGKE